MKFLFSLVILLFFGLYFTNTSFSQINKKSDTLRIPYTYWWPSTGPFIGLCGEKFSIVFTGKITKLYKSSKPRTMSDDSLSVLYTPQKGIIEIKNILFKSPPEIGYKKTPGRNFNNEHFFISDCFYGLNLKEGDNVMVFIFSYEGEYSIPGKAILKIENDSDPIVLSIEKYIKNDQDPIAIKEDLAIWKKQGFDYALQQIIDCRLSKKTNK